MNANTQFCFVNSTKQTASCEKPKLSDHMLMQVASKYVCQCDRNT